MSIRNSEVIKSWKSGKRAMNGRKSLWTDGTWLYSYKLKVGFRTSSGICVLGNYTSSGVYYSQTTSCHIGRVRVAVSSELIWHPAVFEASRDAFLNDIVPSKE